MTTLVHSYARKTGELVEIRLRDNAVLVMAVDGQIIHSETSLRRSQPYSERAAKKRALEYEQQDHKEYDSLIQPQRGDPQCQH